MKTVSVLGISFLNGSVSEIIGLARSGGVLVAPSGPGLATLDKDPDYRSALVEADFVIADSGFMVLVLKLLRRKAPNRVSGLTMIRGLLADSGFLSEQRVLWVLPRHNIESGLRDLLISKGTDSIENHDFCVAPMYNDQGPIEDDELRAHIDGGDYRWVVLCVAGGKQEKLGAYLRDNLSGSPAILCLGAAIAFETGDQANIPEWADRVSLGWLFRLVDNPRLYWPRYVGAFGLLRLLLRDRRS